MLRSILLAVVVALIAANIAAGQDGGYQTFNSDCQSCNPEECQKPTGCVAGIVLDPCGCCEVCGKAEFEMCDHPKVTSSVKYGRCGDDLECRVRRDLERAEGAEAICYCRSEGALCGTDNVTYDSLCQLMAARVTKDKHIGIARQGPCNTAPIIISPPEDMKNKSGSNIAIMCEAKGYPIPTIEWTSTRVDGQTIFLPSDDPHISINMRGGPGKWQVTGWLQIIDLQKHHEGDYTCGAHNEFGTTHATARVNVIGKDSDL